jgi:hypothetical protein
MNETQQPVGKKLDLWLPIVPILISFVSLLISFVSLYYWHEANKAIDRTPQVQIKPIQFMPHTPNSDQCSIIVEITNYSPFPAFDIEWDAALGSEGGYIRNWNRARIIELKAKAVTTPEEDMELQKRKQGVGPLPRLDVEGDSVRGIIGGDYPGRQYDFPVSFRLSWKSREGRTIEKEVKYNVVRTPSGEGEYFSFLKDE